MLKTGQAGTHSAAPTRTSATPRAGDVVLTKPTQLGKLPKGLRVSEIIYRRGGVRVSVTRCV